VRGRTVRLALALVSIGSILIFVRLVAGRLFYPLELDCIEGVMMDHVARLAHGQPIFVAPSLQFVTLAYMPLLAFLASLLARVCGPAFWEPRIISVIAVIALSSIIARAVWLETRKALLALAAPAIYLFAMGLTGNCHDVGRPDSLMLALSFGGLLTLRQTTGRGGAIAAGLLLATAFFAKQHAMWFAFAGGAHLLWNDRPRFLPFALTVAIAAGGTYAALTAWLGPWFPFFTYEVPHDWSEVSAARILHYLGEGVLGSLAMLTMPSILAYFVERRLARGPGGVWVFAALASLGTGLMATLDPSAYLHVLMPTVVAFAILGPIALDALGAQLAAGGRAGAARTLPAALLLLQFIPLVYPIRTQRPHPRGSWAHAQFVARLASLPGGVLVPYHGFYSSQAGKGTSLHIIPLDDIVRAHHNPLLAKDPQYLARMLAPLANGPGRPAIVTDVPLARSGALWATIAPGYRLADSLGTLSEVLVPITGNKYTPTYVYLPVDSSTSLAKATVASVTTEMPRR